MFLKAIQILDLFSPSRRELGVVEVAELLGRPKSTVSGWMSAMEEAGLLDRNGKYGAYRLGACLIALGELSRTSNPIQRVALPVLQKLTQETQETSSLALPNGSYVVDAEVVESTRSVIHGGWLGKRMPLHATAAGKVLLAWRSPDLVRELLREPLERFTSKTISYVDLLLEELEKVREEGVAIAVGEMEEDLLGVAAPVRNFNNEVIAALTVGAPSSRASEEQISLLRRAIKEAGLDLSRRLGHQ